MQYSTIIIALAALVSASPAIDPLTVTSLSPAQITAYASAESAYLASLTGEPAFTSLIMELATDSSALDAFTSAAAALATVSPGQSGAVAGASSLIAQLPGPAASFYNSVLNADIAIASSVVNNVGTSAASGSSGSSGTAKTSSHASTGTAANAASTSGSTATATASTAGAPTNAVVKAAGVAFGVFGAAVAML